MAKSMIKRSSIFLDDIGSFPLPSGVRLKGMSEEKYLELVRDTLEQKKKTGLRGNRDADCQAGDRAH